MFCLFEHLPSESKVVTGNLHLHFNPKKDYIKFAQACYVLQKGAAFMREHIDAEDGNTLPFILCGDFNSGPISSAMSVLHGENIQSDE